MVDSGKREELQNKLIEMANQMVDDCESMPLVLEEAECDRRVYMEWRETEPFMVHFYSVDGCMPEDYKKWYSNYLTNVRAIAPSSVVYEEVEADGGKFCFH